MTSLTFSPHRYTFDSAGAMRALTATVFGLAALAVVETGLAPAAQADDGQSRVMSRFAASGSNSSLSRLGVPPRPAGLDDVDLRVLLTDKGPSQKLDPMPADDTILVAFAINVPEAVDDDLAKQHGLELLERTELAELGLRIVQYRALGNRPVSAILSELRHDQRIRKAQRNVLHTLPGTSPPAAVSANENAKPAPQDTLRRYSAPKQSPARTVQQLAKGPAADRPAIAPEKPVVAARIDPPARVGGVGDVLSGGL